MGSAAVFLFQNSQMLLLVDDSGFEVQKVVSPREFVLRLMFQDLLCEVIGLSV